MLSIGIVGLPNAGKSTLFKALTRQEVLIAPFPFSTVEPNKAVLPVPDRRLKSLAEITKASKVTPKTVEFIDIAGLVKGAHQGEGLGNQFLAQIRNCDAVLVVIRLFRTASLRETHPRQDADIIKAELLLKDLETLNKISSDLEKIKKRGNLGKEEKLRLEAVAEARKLIQEGKYLSKFLPEKQKKILNQYRLLTIKPLISLLNTENTDSEQSRNSGASGTLRLPLKLILELEELPEQEREAFKKLYHIKANPLDEIITRCYNALGVVTFYTFAGGRHLRAWTIEKGKTIFEAAGKIHSDFQERFIRAEVLNWQRFREIKSWKTAREKGLLRVEGRHYRIEDGDIIEIKI